MSHRKPLPRAKLDHHIEWLKNSDLYSPLDSICHAHSVWIESVLSPTKTKRVVQARVACFEHLRALEMSYSEIGRVMLRDSSSVMSALKSRATAKASGVPSDGSEGTKATTP